jgi:GNAT superfamily N-acetyltransferase
MTRWPELELLTDMGTVRRRGPYRVRTIDDPGRALGADRAAALHAMCARAASLSFGVDHSRYWATRPEYFGELSEWSVADRAGDLAGWHALAVWRGNCGTVLYNDTLIVLPGHRRSGLGALLVHAGWLRVAARTRSLPVMAGRTQSPVVQRLFEKFMTTTYPRADGRAAGRLHERAIAAARLIADHKTTGTAPEDGTFLTRGAFPCSLHDRPTSCDDPRVNAFFGRLDVAAGDAVYVVSLMSPLGALRALARYGALRVRLGVAR